MNISTDAATTACKNVNRRVALAAAGLLAVLLVANVSVRRVHAAPDPAPAKLVMAQEFRLVDAAGEERATLALQPDGSPYLSLSDKAKNRRITVRVRPDGGAVMAVNDSDGKNRIALDTQPDGSASVTITSKKGKGGAGMLTPPDGSPVVMVRDKDGTVAFAEPQPEAPDENGAAAKPDPTKKPQK